MFVTAKEIEHTMVHAREVAAHHAKLPAPFSKKTPDTLLLICRDYIGKSVRIFAIDEEPNRVRAFYMAVDDGYEVYILTKQDPLWRDFAACKELFHVVLDDPDTEDCRTVAIYEHVQD